MLRLIFIVIQLKMYILKMIHALVVEINGGLHTHKRKQYSKTHNEKQTVTLLFYKLFLACKVRGSVINM